MTPTFFFYDLETSGFDPRSQRIMQFAGQRTDMDLNPTGEPINILVSLTDETGHRTQNRTPNRTRFLPMVIGDFYYVSVVLSIFSKKTILPRQQAGKSQNHHPDSGQPDTKRFS